MALSRMVGLMLAATASGAVAQPMAGTGVDDYLAAYRTRTAVEPRCSRAQGEEIIVCGRRHADRYRMVYLSYDRGDPRGEGVMGERERISADHPDKCGIGAILAHCGMAGVHVSTNFNGEAIRLRPLAP